MGQLQARPESEITALLHRWSGGDREALAAVIPQIYSELRRIAARHLRRERQAHTLQTTALLNEAYLRLAGQTRTEWRDRNHFFAMAAQMMRRVLVDHARGRGTKKRGGGSQKLSLEEVATLGDVRGADLAALDEALAELERLDPVQGQIVELSFFAGLTQGEIAELLGVSVPTVARRWRLARAWLYRYLYGCA